MQQPRPQLQLSTKMVQSPHILGQAASKTSSPPLSMKIQEPNRAKSEHMGTNSASSLQSPVNQLPRGAMNNLTGGTKQQPGHMQKKIFMVPPSQPIGKKMLMPHHHHSTSEGGRSPSAASAENRFQRTATDTSMTQKGVPTTAFFPVKRVMRPPSNLSVGLHPAGSSNVNTFSLQQGRTQPAPQPKSSSGISSHVESVKMPAETLHKRPVVSPIRMKSYGAQRPLNIGHQAQQNLRGAMQSKSPASSVSDRSKKATGGLWSSLKRSLGFLKPDDKKDFEGKNDNKNNLLLERRANFDASSRATEVLGARGAAAARAVSTRSSEGSTKYKYLGSEQAYNDLKSPGKSSKSQSVERPLQQQEEQPVLSSTCNVKRSGQLGNVSHNVAALATKTDASATETSRLSAKASSCQELDTAAPLPVERKGRSGRNKVGEGLLPSQSEGRLSFRTFVISDSDSDTLSQTLRPEKSSEVNESLAAVKGTVNEPNHGVSSLSCGAKGDDDLLPSAGEGCCEGAAENKTSELKMSERRSPLSKDTEAPHEELMAASAAQQTVVEEVQSTGCRELLSQQKQQSLKEDKQSELLDNLLSFALHGGAASSAPPAKKQEKEEKERTKMQSKEQQPPNVSCEETACQLEQKIESATQPGQASLAKSQKLPHAFGVAGEERKKRKETDDNGKGGNVKVLQNGSKTKNTTDTAVLNVSNNKQEDCQGDERKNIKKTVSAKKHREVCSCPLSLHSEIFHTRDVYKLYQQLKQQQSELRKYRFPFLRNHDGVSDEFCNSCRVENKIKTSPRKVLSQPWRNPSPNPDPLPFPSPLRRPLGCINFSSGRFGCNCRTNDTAATRGFLTNSQCTLHKSLNPSPEKTLLSGRMSISPLRRAHQQQQQQQQQPCRQLGSCEYSHVHPYEVVSFLLSPRPDGQRRQKTSDGNEKRSLISPYGDDCVARESPVRKHFAPCRNNWNSSPRYSYMPQRSASPKRHLFRDADRTKVMAANSFTGTQERPASAARHLRQRDLPFTTDVLGSSRGTQHFRRCCSAGDIINREEAGAVACGRSAGNGDGAKVALGNKEAVGFLARSFDGRVPIPVVDLRRDFKPRLCRFSRSRSLVSLRGREEDNNNNNNDRQVMGGGNTRETKNKNRSSSAGFVPGKRASCSPKSCIVEKQAFPAEKLYSSFEVKEPGRPSAWALGPERRNLLANSTTVHRSIVKKRSADGKDGGFTSPFAKKNNCISNNGNGGDRDNNCHKDAVSFSAGFNGSENNKNNKGDLKNDDDNKNNGSDGFSTILVEEVRLDEQRRPYVLIREVPCGPEALKAQKISVQRLAMPRRVFVSTER